MQIGYARVSTQDQNLDLQVTALLKAGCAKDSIYCDHMSGSRMDRPGLKDALSHLRSGDTLVVWKLDRLARSVKGLVAGCTHDWYMNPPFGGLTLIGSRS